MFQGKTTLLETSPFGNVDNDLRVLRRNPKSSDAESIKPRLVFPRSPCNPFNDNPQKNRRVTFMDKQSYKTCTKKNMAAFPNYYFQLFSVCKVKQ